MAWNEGKKTVLAGSGGVAVGLLVKLSAGKVVKNTASATDDPVGVALGNALENEPAAVRWLNADGTVEIKAAGAIDLNAAVYAAADGEIQALPQGGGDYKLIGKALQAASGDGAIIEVLPCSYGSAIPGVNGVDGVDATPAEFYDVFAAGSGGVAPALLVKFGSGEVVKNTATATDDPIGVAQDTALEDADASVRFLNAPGAVDMTAAGAISQDAAVYAAADGKVQALPIENGTYRRIGIAIEAASADDDIIKVLPYDYCATTTVSG